MTVDPTRRALLRFALATPLAAVPLAVAGCSAATGSRQDEVAARGREVMPFDLEKTTHRFTPQRDGLLEEVAADDPGDAEQVRLVREHLEHEAERFRDGDFGDPARIHGDEMPGLADLERGAERIDVAYREIRAGAAIRFRTADPELVRALHEWGEAQVTDHASHAEHGG